MTMNRDDAVRRQVRALISMHRRGALGGETMPEDAAPDLPRNSAERAHYFTLGMALNYQRNSYALWKSCTAAWQTPRDRWIFDPNAVTQRTTEDLRDTLVRHRVALQPNNHVRNWRTICESLTASYEGDIRVLFGRCAYRISRIKDEVSGARKRFPYLGGTKICNYWLYVMLNYTDFGLTEKAALNVAPDTNVIAASHRLGLICDAELAQSGIAERVAERWRVQLEGTGLDPIDVHTPLWLWSRGKFATIVDGGDSPC
ncbi:MAG TPA: hypothetical protein VII35_03040 [Steroidobacteraceae bacterium]